MELSRRRKKKRKRKNEEEEEDKNVVGGGVGMKKKERSREKHKKKKGKLVDLTTHKPWIPESPKIYIHATELCISIFENIIFLFCVSITLTQNLWVLSDGNTMWK